MYTPSPHAPDLVMLCCSALLLGLNFKPDSGQKGEQANTQACISTSSRP